MLTDSQLEDKLKFQDGFITDNLLLLADLYKKELDGYTYIEFPNTKVDIEDYIKQIRELCSENNKMLLELERVGKNGIFC